MKTRIVVLIDLDDTMTKLVDAWCQWLNKAHGTTVTENDVTDWDIDQFFPSLSEDQVFEPVHTDDFWWQVEPKTDAIYYTKLLIDEGFDVYVCTASGFDTIKDKFDAILKRYFPFITRQKIIVTQNKQLINGDVLIDDGVHNLEGGAYKKILMSAPHNKCYDAESNGMTRVNTWAEAYNAVHAYASEIIAKEGHKNESN